MLPWGTGDPTGQPIPAKYAVVFYMRHPKNSTEVVLLEMESNEVGGTEETLESVKAVWKKAGKGDVWRQSSPLEISMLRPSRYDCEFHEAKIHANTHKWNILGL